jgi:hypothetical protein
MKTDWPEIVWLGLFCATALVGIVIMLPTSAQISVKDWIGALGGWGAALVAIPSLVLLLRQNDFAKEQSRQARSAALVARHSALASEFNFVSDTRKTFENYAFEVTEFIYKYTTDPADHSERIIASVRRFREFIVDTGYLAEGIYIQNPSASLDIQRQEYLLGLQKVQAVLHEFIHIMDDLAKRDPNPEEMASILRNFHKKLHLHPATVEMTVHSRRWQRDISQEIGGALRELNALAGLH